MRTLAALGLDPEKLIDQFGLVGLFGIVFAESGIMLGFFLPGDSLLFSAGLLVATHVLDAPIALVLGGCFLAAVIGDQVGYQFGRRVGPGLFDRPQSRFFKPAHVGRAHAFFERNGAKAIVLARFVPIVRTFAPIVAGVAQMRYRTFAMFNVVGGLVWAVGVTTLGWAVGRRYPWMGEKIDVLVVVIVAVSLVPVGVEYLRHRRKALA